MADMSSENRKRVAFVWNYDVQQIHLLYWWDGLRAAIDKLSEFHDVRVFTRQTVGLIDDFKPDVILVWGSIDSPLCDHIQTFGVPSAFLYAGGPKDHPNFLNFNHIFYESEVDGDEFRSRGHSTSRAFGTNTELFTIQKQPKIFDAIYPATFAKWKRHDIFANAMRGTRSVALGFWQDVETECRTVCEDAGLLVLKAVHPEVLVGMYNASRATVLTADAVGGCQRAVLESLACGVPVVIMADNKKCQFDLPGISMATTPEDVRAFALTESQHSPECLRRAVVENYSETVYMNQLREWIESIKSNEDTARSA